MYKVFNVFTSLNFGGVESHAKIIAGRNQTIEDEFTHSFVAIGSGGATEQNLKQLKADVFVLNRPSKIPSISTILYLVKFFKTHKPDIVHARGAEACFHSLLAAFLAGVPVRVGEEIGIPTHSKVAKLIFRGAYLFSNKVIAISNAVADWIIKNKEAPKHKVIRIYNPVEFKEVKPKDKMNSTFKIGFVGRLEPVKNPKVLIEALAKLREKGINNVRLELLGDGSLMAEMGLLASSLELSKQVTFHGFKNNPEDYISDCDLYIQPSISEGFGIAVVEAMGLGVPVIASSVGGVPEIIEHGKTGWLVDDLSVATITDAIVKAYKLDKEELMHIGLQGKKSVINRFTVERYMHNLSGLYNKLMKA